MDKKELVKYINTISNTGPGGVDKIKEVLKKLVKEGLDNSDDGTESSSGSSVMLIEMEKTEDLGEFKPKTIPDGFADEAEYFDYVWGKVRNGEVALFFKYQDENLETGGPKDVVLPLGFACHYCFEAYFSSGMLDWFYPQREE